MKNTARAIIKINDNYIFMKREKKVNNEIKTFYATVGGHLEDYESFEDACIREVYEELGIIVEIDSLFHEEENIDLDKYEKFYIVNYISGDIGTGNGEEFINIDIDKYGKYEVSFINKNELSNYNILPTKVKDKLIEEINN
ncbi:MAG: NUDIX domain-containing protein [Clostridia bacterium]|nr:NUDIX domain-containing protein [Clostridia bacterium]MDD4386355.1 NUDIX domain-containing protein [Clostridia bacterium]